jgi:hypothetical protein
MDGLKNSFLILKSWHFIKAFVIFIFITAYATNASAWGWSRSPGQSSSAPVPSNETETDSSNDSSSLEATSSEPTNLDAQNDDPAVSIDDIQDVGNITVQANPNTNNQAQAGVNDQGFSDGSQSNSDNLSVISKQSKRRNMLIKKWRAEFAREDLFYVVTGKPLNIPDIKFQLERIQAETPEYSKKQFSFEGSDLALLEEWIDNSLDRRIPQKLKQKSKQSPWSSVSKLDAAGMQKKIADLETKREMLAYGNNALQAMGIFIE